MSEIFRFVWRGALGGAVAPLLLFTYFCSLPFGIAMILYSPLTLVYLAIPGGFVGFIVWLVNQHVTPELGWLPRLLIGALTISAILLLFSLYFYQDSLEQDAASLAQGAQIVQRVSWILIYGSLIGAPAGLCTPGRVRIVNDSRPYDAVESFAEWTPPNRPRQ